MFFAICKLSLAAFISGPLWGSIMSQFKEREGFTLIWELLVLNLLLLLTCPFKNWGSPFISKSIDGYLFESLLLRLNFEDSINLDKVKSSW